MNNFFTDTNKSSVADFHAIVTDHPRMRQLGLGIFTTGDLNTWLHNLRQPHPAPQEGEIDEKFYGNWTAINHTDIDTLLGDDLKSTENWGSFEAWRKHGATGKYEHQEWNSWSWSLEDANFTNDDLLFDDFWAQDGKIITDLVPNESDNGVYLDITDGFQIEKSEPLGRFERNFFSETNSPILQIIEMNRLMTQFKRYYTKSEWDDSTDDKFKPATLFALDHFLTDIKASKYGCIEFSGEVPFYINIADGGIKCVKPEIVKYKLYLYDDSKVRNTDKVVVLKDPKIVGYKKDIHGRIHRGTHDGDMIEANTSVPSDKAVGELEKSWNHYTKKWESGTQNVFAKVVTHIDAAVNNPTVDTLESSDIKADLDGDEDRHFAPSSGLVMPIEMQNANPMQWQPNYASTSGCRDREEDKEKAMLIGFNYNPLKSYPRDTLVMLFKMGGVWHITDMGSGISPKDDPVEATVEGKWQFQYLATNSNSFFTGYTDPDNPLAAENKIYKMEGYDVERALHRDYYLDDPLNGGYDENNFEEDWASSPTNDYTDLEAGLIGGQPDVLWTKKGLVDGFYATRGWWQFTSFDFMDNLIGGTHNGNYIASTNCLNDSTGRSTQLPYGSELPQGAGSTGGFFGCVFPDGYNPTTTSEFFDSNDRDFSIWPYSNYGPFLTTYAAEYVNQLFDVTELYGNRSVKPFQDPANDYRGYIEQDEDGNPIDPPEWDRKYTPERSKQRMMLMAADPELPIKFDEGEGQFVSRDNSYAPSMFFRETHKGKMDLKQLPADIGTLSSPDGENGCPIQNIHALDVLHGDKTGALLRRDIPEIFKERYWLARVDPDGEPTASRVYPDFSSSAYGFEPNNTSRIMFRPLKVGTYTQYFPNLGSRLDDRSVGLRTLERGNWSAEVVRQYHFPEGTASYDYTIASPRSKARELASLGLEGSRAGTVPAEVGGYNLLYSTHKGLLLRGDIHPDGENINVDTGQKSHFSYPSYQSRVHDELFWWHEIFNKNERGSMSRDGLKKDERGANAFGVIGAVATTAANNQIGFHTENRIGMMEESHYDGASAYKKPSWGGSDTSYNTNRTTELHAMVYHAHPRSQTIYDPRYFAVHHFNPHILDAEQYTVLSDQIIKFWAVEFQIKDGEGDLTTIVNGIQSRKIMLNDNGIPIQDEGLYKIDHENRKYEYEVVEPTRFGGDGDLAITCNEGDQVFRDKAFSGTDGSPLTRMHREENWNFNDKRLGKLLPYRYTVKVLGAPWPLNEIIDITHGGGFGDDRVEHSENLLSGDLSSEGVSAWELRDKMVIINRGENFAPGDIVGNAGMGVRLSVAAVDSSGGITKLELYSLGKIEANSCSNSDDRIIPNKAFGCRITRIAGAGSGFSAFFVNAKVVPETRIDHKPRLVGPRSLQLSTNAYVGMTQHSLGTGSDLQNVTIGSIIATVTGNIGSPANNLGYDQGIMYAPVTTAINITPEERAPDRKYDIFFHFHNDITHTWMDPGYGDTQNSMDVDEQHITTQITAF